MIEQRHDVGDHDHRVDRRLRSCPCRGPRPCRQSPPRRGPMSPSAPKAPVLDEFLGVVPRATASRSSTLTISKSPRRSRRMRQPAERLDRDESRRSQGITKIGDQRRKRDHLPLGGHGHDAHALSYSGCSSITSMIPGFLQELAADLLHHGAAGHGRRSLPSRGRRTGETMSPPDEQADVVPAGWRGRSQRHTGRAHCLKASNRTEGGQGAEPSGIPYGHGLGGVAE